MTPLDSVILFIGSFFSVGLLGIQSKNVNQSRYLAAVVTSLFISLSQAIFIRYMATGGLISFCIAAFGGCAGIAASIWFYDNVLKAKLDVKKSNAELLIEAARKNNIRVHKGAWGGFSVFKATND